MLAQSPVSGDGVALLLGKIERKLRDHLGFISDRKSFLAWCSTPAFRHGCAKRSRDRRHPYSPRRSPLTPVEQLRTNREHKQARSAQRSDQISGFPVFWFSGFLAFRLARKADFVMIPESKLFPVDDRARLPIMAENRLPASKKDTLEEGDKGGSGSLNFKVTPEFKKEFKGYAVSQGISMVELLKEGFALSKKRRSQ